MGGNQSSKTEYSGNLDIRNWRKESQENGKTIYSNISDPSLALQEHFISVDSQQQFKDLQQMFQIRKNDPQLVSSHHLKIKKDQELCSKSYNGQLYLQRMPIKLSNITDIPFPDVLHFHFQCLNGFQRLQRRYGSFRVNEDCIGINNRNVVKVWHNHQYDKIYPTHIGHSQQQMVSEIISLIGQNTNHNSMPFQDPSIQNFIYKQTNNVGFSEAKRRLEQYANMYNRGVIPNKLDCAQKVGGAQRINKTYVINKQDATIFSRPSNNYNQYSQPLYHEAPVNMNSRNAQNFYEVRSTDKRLQKQRLTRSQINLVQGLPTRQTFVYSPKYQRINNQNNLINANKIVNQNPFQKIPDNKPVPNIFRQVVHQQIQHRPQINNRKQAQLVRIVKPQSIMKNKVDNKIQSRPLQTRKQLIINKVQSQPTQITKTLEQRNRNGQVNRELKIINNQINKIEKKGQVKKIINQQPTETVILKNHPIKTQKLQNVQIKKIQNVENKRVQINQVINHHQQIIRPQVPLNIGLVQTRNLPQQVQRTQIPQMNKVQRHIMVNEIPQMNKVQNNVINNNMVAVRNFVPQIKTVQTNNIKIRNNTQQIQRNETIQMKRIQMEKPQLVNQNQVMQFPPQQVIQNNQNISQKQQINNIQQRNIQSNKSFSKTQQIKIQKRLPLDSNDQSPIISQTTSPQRIEMQSRYAQQNGVRGSQIRGSQENSESMSSIGISNVPNNKTINKQLSDKMFSEIKEQSIHNTTRNFYNKLMAQDESNMQLQQYEGQTDMIGKKRQYQNIKSGFNPLSIKPSTNNYLDGQKNGVVYSFGNNEEGTSAAFFEKLKTSETSKYNTNYQANNVDYVSETKKYGSLNENGDGLVMNNYLNTLSYMNTAHSPENNKIQQYNFGTPKQNYSPSYDYQYKRQTKQEYKIGDYKFESYGDGYQSYKRTQNYESINEGSAPITQLDNLEMKYSVVEENYNVAWDPQILADLQANVHQN